MDRHIAASAALAFLGACATTRSELEGSRASALLSASAAGNTATTPDETAEEPSFWAKLHDPEDGALDIGEWLASGRGFLPVVTPITEPAVGVGLAGIITYFHRAEKPPGAGDAPQPPPSLSFLGGAGTDNGTRAVFGGHLGIWNDGKTRYLGALFTTDARLSFYGEGEIQALENGISWNLELSGTYQELKFAVAENLFLGAQYLFLNTRSRFRDASRVDPAALESDLGGLGLTLSFDDRDNVFTPNDGLYAKATGTLFDELFGGDFDYPRGDLALFQYWNLEPVVLGLRLEGHTTGSDSPFYGLPYLRMRGVPAFRNLGRHTVVAEVEPRWKLSPRWSLLGFLAAGQAVLSADDFGDVDTIVAGGAGFRYLLARRQGLAVGLDFAAGPEDSTIYFTMGSYWMGL